MVAEQIREEPRYRINGRTAREQNTGSERGRGAEGRETRRAPMAHRGPRVVRKARELSWRSPMTAAILVGTFVVAILCSYVYMYAQVTISGFEQSRLKREIRSEIQAEETLRAEMSRLSLLPTVEQRARAMGMTLMAPQAAEMLTEPAAQQVAQGSR